MYKQGNFSSRVNEAIRPDTEKAIWGRVVGGGGGGGELTNQPSMGCLQKGQWGTIDKIAENRYTNTYTYIHTPSAQKILPELPRQRMLVHAA